MTSLESPLGFKRDIESGNWEGVLSALATYRWQQGSPQELALLDIFELLFQELMLLKEFNVAKLMLATLPIFQRMQEAFSERYSALEILLTEPPSSATALWGQSLEKRRKAVAERKFTGFYFF